PCEASIQGIDTGSSAGWVSPRDTPNPFKFIELQRSEENNTFMKLKLSLCLATLALGIASAASYSVTLTSEISAGSTQLKAGQYKLEVEGNQAIFKQGSTSTAIPISVEKNAKKFRYTTVDTTDSKLHSIELGGTNTKLVVAPVKPA